MDTLPFPFGQLLSWKILRAFLFVERSFGKWHNAQSKHFGAAPFRSR